MSNHKSLASRLLHGVDRLSSRAGAAAAVGLVVAGFLVVLVAFGFRQTWQTAFSTVATGLTLVMVFVIQHTQSREQAATQLKLDELIRALPRADDHLVHIEAGSDEELRDLERRQVDHHVAIRDDE